MKTFQDLKPHLKDVTDEVITAYFRQLDSDWTEADDGPYSAQIGYHLLSKNVAIDQMAEDDVDRFGVNWNGDIKEVASNAFQKQTIIEVDPELTHLVIDYFTKLGLQYIPLLIHATCENDLDTKRSKIYFLKPDMIDLDRAFNQHVLLGRSNRDRSLNRFLQHI